MGTVASTGKLDVSATINATNGTQATSITQSGPTTLTITFSGLTGSDQTINLIDVSNLRVNASLAPSSSQVTLSASGVAGGGITGSISAQAVAFVVQSEVAPKLAGAANQSLCNISSSSVYPVVTTTVQENFNSAFKTAAQINSLPPYYGTSAIAASQGTVLAVTFTNLVPGVSYYVPTTVGNAVSGTPASLVLTAYTAATGATPATPVTVGGQSLVPVTVSGTSGTVYYGVTTSNTAAVEAASILLSENIQTPGAVTAVSTTPVAASVSLVGVTSGYPQFAANSYAGTQPTAAGNNGLLTACTTTLLFPYATNTQGYDMGFSIANASSMPGSNPVAQSGTCTVYFYGTAAPSAPYVTAAIPNGTIAAGILSNIAPGFDGYIVAVCNFQAAYGYAIISNGFATGTGGVSGNYLAIQNPTTTTP
jgi:hypothetical protein